MGRNVEGSRRASRSPQTSTDAEPDLGIDVEQRLLERVDRRIAQCDERVPDCSTLIAHVEAADQRLNEARISNTSHRRGCVDAVADDVSDRDPDGAVL